MRAALLCSGALIVAVLVVGGGYYLLTTLAFGSPCSNTEIFAVASPDGQRRVVVFGRSCGATTAFNSQASLLPAGQVLENEAGNLFIADTNHGAAPSGPGGGPEVRVVWKSPATIALAHHGRARVFRSESSVAGVAVHYSTFE
jgi:hypothetical protein